MNDAEQLSLIYVLASTAETKPSSAVLYPGNAEWTEQQRRSCVSLGNHSSNSKSSSNLTGSSHSSRHGDRPRDTPQAPPQVRISDRDYERVK